jgi:hypothetical protein
LRHICYCVFSSFGRVEAVSIRKTRQIQRFWLRQNDDFRGCARIDDFRGCAGMTSKNRQRQEQKQIPPLRCGMTSNGALRNDKQWGAAE